MTPLATSAAPAAATFSRVLVLGSAQHDAAALFEATLPLLQPGHASVCFKERPPRPRARPLARGEPIARVVESLERLGIEVHHERHPAPAEALAREALKDEYDLIVKAVAVDAYDRRTPEPLDLQIIERAPAAVFLVECDTRGPVRRVVAAVDPHPRDRGAEGEDGHRRALTIRIAATAGELASRTGAELHVVHAWSVFGEQVLQHVLRVTRERLETQREDARAVAAHGVREVLRAAGVEPPPEHVHLVKGAFGEAAPALIDDLAADVVVLGTRGRIGWIGPVVQPHAADLVCNTRASLVVLKQVAR
jgi:nucleotide-binding universal stress UspA family protein